MGLHLDRSSHALGMCLAVYVLQLILQEISSTVWVLGGWASRSSKVILCVTWSKGRKMGSSNTSENSSKKAEIHGSLAPGAKGVQGPFYSPSNTSLTPIAGRLLDGLNNVNHAALYNCERFSSRTSKNTAQHESHTITR